MTKTRIPLFLVALGIFGSFVVNAAPVELWFQKANQFYENAQYDSAQIYYEKIVGSGMVNSSVQLNLGNTYYREKKIGQALLHYYRAEQLSPNDPDVLANIRFANKNIVDRVPEPNRGAFGSFLWRFHTIFPLQAQLWIQFGLFCGIGLIISLGMFVSRNIRLWLIYLGSLLGVASVVLCISLFIKIYTLETTSHAVVLSETVDALNAPKGEKVQFTAHEGTRFLIRKKSGDWVLVSLPNGLSGWVENSSIGRI